MLLYVIFLFYVFCTFPYVYLESDVDRVELFQLNLRFFDGVVNS